MARLRNTFVDETEDDDRVLICKWIKLVLIGIVSLVVGVTLTCFLFELAFKLFGFI